MIISILKEYGMGWAINRLLYSAKLKMMSMIPITEKLFEKNVRIKRIDLFDFDVDRIKGFLEELPVSEQNKIVVIADKAINGLITGFSSIELDYGDPINWQLNPITGSSSNLNSKWYRIPDFDANSGDIKVVWEASRFIHFFYFARAYLITGKVKYYDAFSEQLTGWLKDNIYSFGPNYKCGQECTLRMINALMVYKVFHYYKLTTVEDENNIRCLVEVCYKKVLSNFFYAHKCIKNNHTFSEICGLIVGTWCCDDRKGLVEAYKLLDQETERAFLLDGGYTQYSFNYQRFTLQLFECVYKISTKTGLSISNKSRELLINSILLMFQVQEDITGDVPNYGSNDGALIFPLAACDYRDFRPSINALYALTTGKRLFVDGQHDEELLWFGEEKDYPVVQKEKVSSAFIHAGIYTLRHEGGFLMTVLQTFKGRPSHMDGLHIDLWHNAKNIFCDSGTYSYASRPVNEIASTLGHNTVKVCGLEQMNKRGEFLLYNWTQCKAVEHDENRFSGTLISKNGYEHSRIIKRIGNRYEIMDEVNGCADSCSILFHTPYEVKLVFGGFEIWDSGEKLCDVQTEPDIITVEKAYRSLFYMKKEEINRVVVKCNTIEKCNFKFEITLA